MPCFFFFHSNRSFNLWYIWLFQSIVVHCFLYTIGFHSGEIWRKLVNLELKNWWFFDIPFCVFVVTVFKKNKASIIISQVSFVAATISIVSSLFIFMHDIPVCVCFEWSDTKDGWSSKVIVPFFVLKTINIWLYCCVN